MGSLVQADLLAEAQREKHLICSQGKQVAGAESGRKKNLTYVASFHFKRNVQLTLQRREQQIQFNARVHHERQKAMLICLFPLTKAFSFISRFVRMASPVTTPTCVYFFPQRCILTGQKQRGWGGKA